MKLTDSDVARYWAKVDKRSDDECWPWTGATAKGYGRFWLGTRESNHVYQATHVAYFLHYGEEMDGLFACHTCDNHSCCNPLHLWKGTNRENGLDSVSKGRNKYVLPAQRRGDENPQCKITDEQVSMIRSMYAPRKFTQQKLADIFGVSREHVRDILLGRKRR